MAFAVGERVEAIVGGDVGDAWFAGKARIIGLRKQSYP
jgi:hypothetical protein